MIKLVSSFSEACYSYRYDDDRYDDDYLFVCVSSMIIDKFIIELKLKIKRELSQHSNKTYFVLK